MLSRFSCLLALAVAPLFADPPQPVVINAVTDQFRPLALSQQKLAGVLGERIRAAREGYLEHPGEKALLASRGQTGRYLEAAATAYDYSHDPNLKTMMDRVAKAFLSGQPGVELASRRDELLGLLAYYRVTGDEGALTSAKKIGDLVLQPSNDRALGDEASLIEPLVYLYRYTGNTRYLNFCESIAHSAGETVPDLTGLIELYRTTGDNSYFRRVTTAWPALQRKYFALTSTLSEMSNPCNTASWMQLTLNILRLTGDPEYGEELEHVIYNQLFAAQDPKTGKSFAAVPVNGVKIASPVDACIANEAAGVVAIPPVVWGRYGNGIAVVLYSAGRATFQLRRRGTVQVYSESAYPSTGEILLHVEPSRNIQFPLRLRVPRWTKNFVVDIGGTHLIGTPGELLTLVREWKRGDTVRIAIDMTVHVIRTAAPSTNEIAIQRGPQILALGKTLNPEITDLADASLISSEPSQLAVLPRDSRFPAAWAGDQAYTVHGQYRGKPTQLVLVPFADALDYRVFLKIPNPVSGASDQ